MVLGIQTIETCVWWYVTGILTAYLHNKFNKIELPAYLGSSVVLVLYLLLLQLAQYF